MVRDLQAPNHGEPPDLLNRSLGAHSSSHHELRSRHASGDATVLVPLRDKIPSLCRCCVRVAALVAAAASFAISDIGRHGFSVDDWYADSRDDCRAARIRNAGRINDFITIGVRTIARTDRLSL